MRVPVERRSARKNAQRDRGEREPAAISRRIEEHDALVEALPEWLNRHVPDAQPCKHVESPEAFYERVTKREEVRWVLK
jgi:hypothetical protein